VQRLSLSPNRATSCPNQTQRKTTYLLPAPFGEERDEEQLARTRNCNRREGRAGLALDGRASPTKTSQGPL